MPDRSILETFPNPHPSREYVIEHHVHEFTSLCPNTGQPDFATIKIRYVANAACVELRSLKAYLQTFRNEGIFYEDVTNVVLDDLVACCRPRRMVVESTWSVRGGIHSVITARYGEPLPGTSFRE
ncbi:MAG: preQ(1) synthase [Phycisphaerae bacterium]